jgi:hypothetical protein|eukprot:SAG25_NODE_1033_length_4221_cov_1.963852_2_plen_101_part_00
MKHEKRRWDREDDAAMLRMRDGPNPISFVVIALQLGRTTGATRARWFRLLQRNKTDRQQQPPMSSTSTTAYGSQLHPHPVAALMPAEHLQHVTTAASTAI